MHAQNPEPTQTKFCSNTAFNFKNKFAHFQIIAGYQIITRISIIFVMRTIKQGNYEVNSPFYHFCPLKGNKTNLMWQLNKKYKHPGLFYKIYWINILTF